MADSTSTRPALHTAIIGGGITGVILALGLERRGVSYTLYERAPAFTEIGAGIGFSPNAERALRYVDPKVYSVYKKVASTTGDKEDYFNWVDGYRTNELVARLLIGVDAFQGGRRSDFLEAWSKLIPSDKVRFDKELVEAVNQGDGTVSLEFKDGTRAVANFGCDGIRSRVRHLIIGEKKAQAHPHYTNKFCFRALLPMDKAREVLGDARTESRFMYNGPGRHAITYAVAEGKLLNALFVIHDPNPWPYERHTAPGTKQEVVDAYADWHPVVRGLVDLLPEKLDKWAIFDMFDAPTPYYNLRNIALAGDAAHASGPHLGSGAGFGIEDALVLACLLKLADEAYEQNRPSLTKERLCDFTLKVYHEIRYERDEWLPKATRDAADHFQAVREGWTHDDRASFLKSVSELYHTIWDKDISEMLTETTMLFNRTMMGMRPN
ncbi:hypothetical protein NPX13_g2753 [Xylaria arbuscula]|uniref:FAD-binding domain-containing protein n=1 Tax=Xylaria arbuscula TaxID=114810 RepID=A0A9W8NJ23_9PEZI|nr:hypothetical protein NPX13_g2753 [Xylaria arbuscula]